MVEIRLWKLNDPRCLVSNFHLFSKVSCSENSLTKRSPVSRCLVSAQDGSVVRFLRKDLMVSGSNPPTASKESRPLSAIPDEGIRRGVV